MIDYNRSDRPRRAPQARVGVEVDLNTRVAQIAANERAAKARVAAARARGRG